MNSLVRDSNNPPSQLREGLRERLPTVVGDYLAQKYLHRLAILSSRIIDKKDCAFVN
jgi:hypothetical protein